MAMQLLSAPFEPHALRRRGALGGPIAGIAAASLVLAVGGLGVGLAGGPWRAVGVGIVVGSAQGALLAIGWAVALDGAPGGACAAARLWVVLLVASAASRWSPWAAVLYFAVPLLLVREGARHPALRGMGLREADAPRHVLLGVAGGAFLGGHLLVSASQTLEYGVRVPGAATLLMAAAYDVGANALTAEWLFRGALFSRWWRRWDFWPAAGLSTALCVARYLADPALPPVLEMRVGAVFYTALLGFGACALRAASGSLLPGYLASVVFFLFYRLLAP